MHDQPLLWFFMQKAPIPYYPPPPPPPPRLAFVTARYLPFILNSMKGLFWTDESEYALGGLSLSLQKTSP